MLTLEDIREGIAVTTEYRRVMVWRGIRLASYTAVCGLLASGIACLHGAPVTVWMFLLPVLLAVVPAPVREALHFPA